MFTKYIHDNAFVKCLIRVIRQIPRFIVNVHEFGVKGRLDRYFPTTLGTFLQFIPMISTHSSPG